MEVKIENLKDGSWDVKEITLYIGSLDPTLEEDFITFRVFNDKFFDISVNRGIDGNADFYREELSLDVALRLRDFLNYALNGK